MKCKLRSTQRKLAYMQFENHCNPSLVPCSDYEVLFEDQRNPKSFAISQFYYWFKFYFTLFRFIIIHYHTIPVTTGNVLLSLNYPTILVSGQTAEFYSFTHFCIKPTEIKTNSLGGDSGL